MYLMLWKPAKQLIFELFFYSLLKAKRIYSMMMACVCVYIYMMPWLVNSLTAKVCGG